MTFQLTEAIESIQLGDTEKFKECLNEHIEQVYKNSRDPLAPANSSRLPGSRLFVYFIVRAARVRSQLHTRPHCG